MVVKNDSRHQQQKELEAKLNIDEEIRKEQLLAELKESSFSVICLAVMYAKNFEEMGVDVTKRLITANQNVEILEAAYKKGVDDTLARIRKGNT